MLPYHYRKPQTPKSTCKYIELAHNSINNKKNYKTSPYRNENLKIRIRLKLFPMKYLNAIN